MGRNLVHWASFAAAAIVAAASHAQEFSGSVHLNSGSINNSLMGGHSGGHGGGGGGGWNVGGGVGGGLSVSGTWNSGDFNGRISIRSGLVTTYVTDRGRVRWIAPLYNQQSWREGMGGRTRYVGDLGYNHWWDWRRGGDQIRGSYARFDPNLLPGVHSSSLKPSPERPALTPLELSTLAFDQKRYPDAVTHLRAHLVIDSEDVSSMRLLALALVGSRRVEDGIAAMRLAYSIDPLLVSKPIDFAASALTAGEFRQLLAKVSSAAGRSNAGSAWLTMAVMMQAEDRLELAQKALERGIKAGLSNDLGLPLRAELQRAIDAKASAKKKASFPRTQPTPTSGRPTAPAKAPAAPVKSAPQTPAAISTAPAAPTTPTNSTPQPPDTKNAPAGTPQK